MKEETLAAPKDSLMSSRELAVGEDRPANPWAFMGKQYKGAKEIVQ